MEDHTPQAPNDEQPTIARRPRTYTPQESSGLVQPLKVCVSVTVVETQVIIKTLAGAARMVGFEVDSYDDPDILGCVSGNDMVLTVCRSEEAANRLAEIFRQRHYRAQNEYH